MAAINPLAASELERLSALLASESLPQAMPLDALQAAYFALASGPGDPPDAATLVALALGDDAQFDDDAARADVESLITRFAAECQRDLLEAEDTLPLILFDDDAGKPDYATWCRGYLDGVVTSEPAWDGADNDALDDLLLPIEVLAADPEHDAELLDSIDDLAAFRREAARDLVDVLLEIRDLWFDRRTSRVPVRRETPKVGRNDPCPCGSGRKFKQCHGRAP